MSKLADRSIRRDRFHHKAKRHGYLARAAFKLVELDDQFKLLKPGQRVLDLGCAPGSWLQYARSKVGDKGQLVGLDRGPLRGDVAGARIVVGDVMTVEPAVLRGDLPGFDIVLSDMAPDTSGVRQLDQARSETLFERALELAEALSARGGHFVGKLFVGPAFQEPVGRCRKGWEKAATMKPKSSRAESIEQYVVALRRR